MKLKNLFSAFRKKDVVNDEKNPTNDFADNDTFDLNDDFNWYTSERVKLKRQKSQSLTGQDVVNKTPKSNLSKHNFSKDQQVILEENASEKFQKKGSNKKSVEQLEELYLYKLPVFGFSKVSKAPQFALLPLSSDPALLNAIEQVREEDEEDEQIRALALRVLAAFKTRNSVEAVSQIALYDFASELRIKAINVLVEFNHESVFETVLLACADPAREVKAAAALGLSKLTCDRSEAWTRILESENESRIKQAAYAAMVNGFLRHSFTRLIDAERKHAYEAFVLLTLMIKAGEAEQILEVLKNNPSIRIKKALLQVCKLSKSRYVIEKLESFLKEIETPNEIKEEVKLTIENVRYSIGFPEQV